VQQACLKVSIPILRTPKREAQEKKKGKKEKRKKRRRKAALCGFKDTGEL
jgi:hypothetical protein